MLSHGGRVGAVACDGQPHFASIVAAHPHVVVVTGVARVAQVSDETDVTGAAQDPEDQAAAVEAAMAEVRARLAEVPVEGVVVNHVMGLYELAAIHLSATEPDLRSATLAIDAMALLVDGLGDRLGEDAQAMRDALANIRMAFVSVKTNTGQAGHEG